MTIIPLKLFWNLLEDFEQTRIFGIFPQKSLVTLTTDEIIAEESFPPEFGSRTKYDPGPAQQKKDVCLFSKKFEPIQQKQKQANGLSNRLRMDNLVFKDALIERPPSFVASLSLFF